MGLEGSVHLNGIQLSRKDMIIGLCGIAGSGKDTVADFLVKNHGFVKVALADPLKRICKEVFGFTDEQLWGPSEMRNAPDPRYRRVSQEDEKRCTCKKKFRDAEDFRDHLPCIEGPTFLTPRFALQQLGTEWGRNCYPNVWIDYALRVAKRLLTPDLSGYVPGYDARFGFDEHYTGVNKGVVISDVRFLNEVNAIIAAQGIVWRINRPGAGLSGSAAKHASESEQLEIPREKFHMEIPNYKGLQDLENAVKMALTIQGVMSE